MLLERSLTLVGAMVCRVMGGMEEHEICALKTLEQARKPTAEVLGDNLFEENCKTPAQGPSALCIHGRPKYSHPHQAWRP